MKIILNTEIIGLGEEGDVITVSNGYARNFLLPEKKALMYNSQNKAILDSQHKAIEKRRSDRRIAYMGVKERIDSLQLTIKMKTGESGHLFGSVNSAIIAEHLKKQDIEVSKKQIIIPNQNIKEIGNYEIEIKLLAGITSKLQLSVEDIEGKVTLEKIQSNQSFSQSNDYNSDSNSFDDTGEDTPVTESVTQDNEIEMSNSENETDVVSEQQDDVTNNTDDNVS